jgi:thiol:disulfide interchange protein DsbC
MKKVTTNIFGIVLLSVLASSVYADNLSLEDARKNIVKQFENVNPNNITQSPIPGLYQISMPPQFFYASADGHYIVDGDLIDMTTRQNVSQVERNSSVADAVTAMGEDSMIIFGKKSLKNTVTVFTDIDCGYCRKLHGEMKKYNELGIRVRYMAYPRAGLGSDAFNKAEAVWCSKDKANAMTLSKNGQSIKSEKCESPVAKQYELGNKIGIRGTPAILLADGTVIPGYVPAARLLEIINK